MPTGEIRSRSFFRQIIADENGLRWQESLGGEWQTASWEDVTDFYTEPTDSSRFVSATRRVVCFRDGRTLACSILWSSNYQALGGMVECNAHAENARRPDGTIGWELKGTRPADLPTSFTYSEEFIQKVKAESTRKILTSSAVLVGLFTLAIFFKSFSGVLPGLIGGIAPHTALEIYRRPKGKQVREAKRRIQQGERFEVTQDALTIWQNGEKYTIPWSDIIGYDEPVFILRPKEDTVRLRTITGKEFSFTSLMEGAERLPSILRLYAREAVAYRRGKNEQEALGGVQIRWTGRDEGKGDRVFHQRTRTNRRYIVWGWIAPLFQALALLLLLGSSLLLLCVMLMAILTCLIFVLPRTLRYFRDKVVISKDHIAFVKHGKETLLTWNEVTNLEVTPSHLILESKERTTQRLKTFTFTLSDYAYGNELPDLIREHIEQAKAKAERAAISAADVAQQAGEARVWSNDTILREQQTVRVER